MVGTGTPTDKITYQIDDDEDDEYLLRGMSTLDYLVETDLFSCL